MPKNNRKTEAVWMPEDKRWRISVQVDGKRRAFYSSTPGRKGKIEAERKADAWLDGGASADPRFEDLWADFLKDQKVNTGTSNYKKHESIGRNYLLPLLGTRRISKLKAQHFQECINYAHTHGKVINNPGKSGQGRPRLAGDNNGLSKKSLSNIRASLSAVRKYAARREIELPSTEFLVIPREAPVGERHILQPDDMKKLFEIDYITEYGVQRSAHYIHAWRFAVLTGLRPGELYGLRHEDIVGDVMTIRRARNIEQETTQGKNDNARRWFMVPKHARAVLDDQARLVKSLGIISPWVFPDEEGNQTEQLHPARLWRTYKKQHDIAVTPYEMRHTMISISGVEMPEKLLKSIVGHGVDMDTLRVYGHEVDGEMRRAQEILDDIFTRILK